MFGCREASFFLSLCSPILRLRAWAVPFFFFFFQNSMISECLKAGCLKKNNIANLSTLDKPRLEKVSYHVMLILLLLLLLLLQLLVLLLLLVVVVVWWCWWWYGGGGGEVGDVVLSLHGGARQQRPKAVTRWMPILGLGMLLLLLL